MIKRFAIVVALCISGCVSVASADPVDAGAVIVPAFIDAGAQAAPAVTVSAGSGSTVTVTPAAIPDPIEHPAEAASLLSKLYRGGWFGAGCIMLAFFALTVAEKKVAWLKIGWRKVAVASLLAGLATLTAAASDGTTPNGAQIFGALMAAGLLAIKAYGMPKDAEAS